MDRRRFGRRLTRSTEAAGMSRVLHHGRVTRRDGARANKALVFVKTGTAPTPEIGIVCNEDGEFKLALPPGRYVVEARSNDGRSGTVEIETQDHAREISIVLDD
jgi:hypothetical protein